MTENDRLLLIDFKKAKHAYDHADILARLETATNCGWCLTALQYLDDPELNLMAKTARLEFGDPKDWPPSKTLYMTVRAAEDRLSEAISSVVPE